MHSSYADIRPLLDNQQPAVLALTETKHGHITGLWRTDLKKYKIIQQPAPINEHTGRRYAGTILAVLKDIFISISAIKPPNNIGAGHLAVAEAIPYSGAKLILISAYMPQTNTPQSRDTYKNIITWISSLPNKYPYHTIILGGDLQASPDTNSQSYNPILEPIKNLMSPLSDPTLPTFQPAGTSLDHWLNHYH